MTEAQFFPLAVVIALFIFSFVNRRLKRAAQPLRLRLAEKGEEFLAKPDLPKPMREHVEFLLKSSFNMRGSLLLAIVMIPIIAFLFVVRHRYLRRSVDKLNVTDQATRASFYDLCRLHDRITLTNHIFLLPIVELELVLFMPLAIVLRGIVQGTVPETGGRESVITFIEDKRIHGFHFSHANGMTSNH